MCQSIVTVTWYVHNFLLDPCNLVMWILSSFHMKESKVQRGKCFLRVMQLVLAWQSNPGQPNSEDCFPVTCHFLGLIHEDVG